MNDERFLTGYCRHLDACRTVCADLVDGYLKETDCFYGKCIYEAACPIAKELALLEKKA